MTAVFSSKSENTERRGSERRRPWLLSGRPLPRGPRLCPPGATATAAATAWRRAAGRLSSLRPPTLVAGTSFVVSSVSPIKWNGVHQANHSRHAPRHNVCHAMENQTAPVFVVMSIVSLGRPASVTAGQTLQRLRPALLPRPKSLPCGRSAPRGLHRPYSMCRGHGGWQVTHTQKTVPELNGKALDQPRQRKEPGPPCTPRARQLGLTCASVRRGLRIIAVTLFSTPHPFFPCSRFKVPGQNVIGEAGSPTHPRPARDRRALWLTGLRRLGPFLKGKLECRYPKKVTGHWGLSIQKQQMLAIHCLPEHTAVLCWAITVCSLVRGTERSTLYTASRPQT